MSGYIDKILFLYYIKRSFQTVFNYRIVVRNRLQRIRVPSSLQFWTLKTTETEGTLGDEKWIKIAVAVQAAITLVSRR